jgi:hypothetical protein
MTTQPACTKENKRMSDLNPTWLSFEDLRRRWQRNGKPMTERTARRYSVRIGRIKIGRAQFYPLAEVERYEREHFIEGR